ncbi:MAG: DUF2461 domain-containing protein [Clostridiales bacterium]|nr:DUF2461 domain-containing protein [Clostridiales bacterium]
MFNGFPEETVRFFLGLRFHNDASYFNDHRDEYEAYVKKPFFEFIAAMTPALEEIADDFELRPAKCLARIRRDTRFTKDKTPYRDHLWLMFKRSGEPRDETVMYWFELSPDTVNWGLGFWGQNRPAMDAMRTMIEQKPSEMLDALTKAGIPDEMFSIDGGVYQKKEIPEGVPDALKDFYPHKELYLCRRGISLSDAYSGNIARQCGQDYLRLKPLYTLFRNLADLGRASLDA